MRKTRPTYQQLEKRLAAAEPVVEALKRHEVDAVVGKEKIAFLLLRKVEEAWLESNGEFSAMFNLDGIGMFQADMPAFRFTRVNPKFCEMTGYTEEELLTKSYTGLTHQEDCKRDLKEVAGVIRGKTDSWSIEKRCVRKDGNVVWVGVHGTALRNLAGRVVMIMAMVKDATARKQAEQQLDEARAQLQQFKDRTAEMSRLLRSLRNQVAGSGPAERLRRTIQELIDRLIGPGGKTPTAARNRPPPRKKASFKRTRKSAGRKSSGKSRPRSQ